MELAVINTEVFIVKMENKPLLAVAMEKPKLRDYPLEIRNQNTLILIKRLLNVLGVNGSDKIEHHTALHELINDAYLNYTYEEIKLAFEYYLKGKYFESGKPIMITQQLNGVVFSKVMNHFGRLKKSNEMDAYRRKLKDQQMKETELTQEKKDEIVRDGLINCYNKWLKTKKIEAGYLWVYDHLDELKLLNFTAKQKKQRMVDAREYLENQAANELDKSKRNDIKRAVENIYSKPIINKAKRLIVGDYFQSLLSDFGHIKDKI